MHRQDEDADAGPVLSHLFGDFHSVHTGHGDVENDEVGREFANQPQRLFTGARFAHDIELTGMLRKD